MDIQHVMLWTHHYSQNPKNEIVHNAYNSKYEHAILYDNGWEVNPCLPFRRLDKSSIDSFDTKEATILLWIGGTIVEKDEESIQHLVHELEENTRWIIILS